jgi:hypothetical protein
MINGNVLALDLDVKNDSHAYRSLVQKRVTMVEKESE